MITYCVFGVLGVLGVLRLDRVIRDILRLHTTHGTSPGRSTKSPQRAQRTNKFHHDQNGPKGSLIHARVRWVASGLDALRVIKGACWVARGYQAAGAPPADGQPEDAGGNHLVTLQKACGDFRPVNAVI